MSLLNLSIAGVALNLTVKYTPRWPARKFYNAAYFHDDTYRHEIANHYRDYKHNPRIRRKRVRKVVVRTCKSSSAYSGNSRPLLPLNALYFPRFADVPTLRREHQRTLSACEGKPSELQTYNDRVRRIWATNSCEQLKALAQRLLDLTSASEARRREQQSRKSWRWNWRSIRSSSSNSNRRRRTSEQVVGVSSSALSEPQKRAISDEAIQSGCRRYEQQAKPLKWYKHREQQQQQQQQQQLHHDCNYTKEIYFLQRSVANKRTSPRQQQQQQHEPATNVSCAGSYEVGRLENIWGNRKSVANKGANRRLSDDVNVNTECLTYFSGGQQQQPQQQENKKRPNQKQPQQLPTLLLKASQQALCQDKEDARAELKCSTHANGPTPDGNSHEQYGQRRHNQQFQQLYKPNNNNNTTNNICHIDANSNSIAQLLRPHYLQQATAYYEQGLLKNIRYLESIGARHIRLQSVPAAQINTTHQDGAIVGDVNDSNSSSSSSSGGVRDNKTTKSTITLLPAAATSSHKAHCTADLAKGERQTVEGTHTAGAALLSTLLKRIRRKRSFRVGVSDEATNADYNVNDDSNNDNHNFDDIDDSTEECNQQQSDWAIRVNIKPAGTSAGVASGAKTVPVPQRTDRAGKTDKANRADRAPQRSVNSSFPKSRCSMNDYFRGVNTQTISNVSRCQRQGNYRSLGANNKLNSAVTLTTPSPTPTEPTTSTKATRLQFHELIDNLMQLDIGDLDAQLPKITLTDCSTTQAPPPSALAEQHASLATAAEYLEFHTTGLKAQQLQAADLPK